MELELEQIRRIRRRITPEHPSPSDVLNWRSSIANKIGVVTVEKRNIDAAIEIERSLGNLAQTAASSLSAPAETPDLN